MSTEREYGNMMKLFTKNKKKKDNKGFSLVELIVVIAIMAILAVALAPRLIHYLDKARKSNDNQVIDVAAQAIQTSIVDDKLYKKIKSEKGNWFVVASGTTDALTYDTTNANLKPLVEEIANVVSGDTTTKINLQSDDADVSGTNYIIAKFDNQYDFEVRLYYAKNTLTNVATPGNSDTADYFAQNSK